ncbi:uncharacterized protein VP01_863g1 [Puccinia sorghi]|uniref:Uncharacterized protein n=1 Tax=Puccinia sorghi TaxID=27349 RepID=A0A0L6U9J4_9BASI|nr:uncharacterized protein VP01_863g1 [Puccinia sorghi]
MSPQQLTLAFLSRAIAALAARKLPTQPQLDHIITAILNSPIFALQSKNQQQPELIRAIAHLLLVFKHLSNSKNTNNQLQRLIQLLLINDQQPQLTLPSLSPVPASSSSPKLILKRLLLTSVELPQDLNEILQEALDLLSELFKSSQESPSKTINGDQSVDRIVSKFVKLIVHLRRNLGDLLSEEIHSIKSILAHDLQGFQVNDEFRQLIALIGECINGFCAGEDDDTSDYWHSLVTPFNQLVELLAENQQELLEPLKKVQMLIVDLFNNFEDQLYSPKLYESLGVALKEFQEASRHISQPMEHMIHALERIRIRIVVEDTGWRELYQAFQRVSSELLSSSTGSAIANSKHVARHATSGVAKTAFNALVEYLVPRLLLLIKPASFTSTSGFLPSSMTSTTVQRFEISQRSPKDAPESIGRPHTLSVWPSTHQKISIVGLRVLSKNVGFYFHKKVDQEKSTMAKKLDFTNFEDEGKLDVFLGMSDQDGLSFDLELDWNYHMNSDRSSEVNRRARGTASVKNTGGLFLIKSFKVDLKKKTLTWMPIMGISAHNLTSVFPTHLPIGIWSFPSRHQSSCAQLITETIQEYILEQLTSLNQMLGNMRIRWEEMVDSGRNTTWEKIWEVMQMMVSSTDEGEQPESKSRMDGSGLEIEAEDGSYTMRIGIGQKMLPGKGLGGPGRFKERLAAIADDAGAAFDRRVGEITGEFAQATIAAERPGWQSDIFNV